MSVLINSPVAALKRRGVECRHGTPRRNPNAFLLFPSTLRFNIYWIRNARWDPCPLVSSNLHRYPLFNDARRAARSHRKRRQHVTTLSWGRQMRPSSGLTRRIVSLRRRFVASSLRRLASFRVGLNSGRTAGRAENPSDINRYNLPTRENVWPSTIIYHCTIIHQCSIIYMNTFVHHCSLIHVCSIIRHNSFIYHCRNRNLQWVEFFFRWPKGWNCICELYCNGDWKCNRANAISPMLSRPQSYANIEQYTYI